MQDEIGDAADDRSAMIGGTVGCALLFGALMLATVIWPGSKFPNGTRHCADIQAATPTAVPCRSR
jgi:hypothetical protein